MPSFLKTTLALASCAVGAAAVTVAARPGRAIATSAGPDAVGLIQYSCTEYFIPGNTANWCGDGRDYQGGSVSATVQALGVEGTGTPTVSGSPAMTNCVPAGSATLRRDMCLRGLEDLQQRTGCNLVQKDVQDYDPWGYGGGMFYVNVTGQFACVAGRQQVVSAFDQATRIVYGIAPIPKSEKPAKPPKP